MWIKSNHLNLRGTYRLKSIHEITLIFTDPVCEEARQTRGVKMMRSIMPVLGLLFLIWAWPAESADRTAQGAAIGAGVGLIAGKSAKDAAKGALVGGGAGALTKKDVDEKKTKKYAKDGALIGAGVGLLTDGAGGAVKGAVYGGSAGAVVGDQKSKN
jgi:hypothetical protein